MHGRRSFALGTAMLFALACGGVLDAPIGTATPNGSTPGGSTIANAEKALVGRWLNVRFLVDDFGDLHASETTWQFYSDLCATKTLVTRNLSEGFYDVIVDTFRWSTTGELLSIRSPSGTNLSLAYRISGDTLFLVTQPFLRLP